MAKQAASAPGEKLIVKNRRAPFDYELGDSYEAGIVLRGSEVKSLRAGTVDITDAWASVDKGEAWLKNLSIQAHPHAAFPHELRRARKLLLHGREIAAIEKELAKGSVTLVPVRLYWKNGHAKVELALGHGRKKGDKREHIKERETVREVRSAMARDRKG